MSAIPTRHDTLWTLITAPVIWAAHFLFCYVFAAVFCAKPEIFGNDFVAVRVAIAIATLAALSIIVASSWLAWRQWGFGSGDPPHDDPTTGDRRLFQGFATLLLCGLSFVSVVLVALPALFITECLR